MSAHPSKLTVPKFTPNLRLFRRSPTGEVYPSYKEAREAAKKIRDSQSKTPSELPSPSQAKPESLPAEDEDWPCYFCNTMFTTFSLVYEHVKICEQAPPVQLLAI